MPRLPLYISKVQKQKFDRDLRALQRQSNQLNQELTSLPTIPKESVNNPVENCLSESSNSAPNTPPESPHSFSTPRPESVSSSSSASPSITQRVLSLASGVSQKETSRRVPLPSLPSSPSDSPRSPCIEVETMSKAEETSNVLSALTDAFKDLSRSMRGNNPQPPSLCSRIGRNAEELEAFLDCVLTFAEEQQWNRTRLLTELRPISCDRFLTFLTYEVEANWEVSEEFNDRQRFRRVCVHCLVKPLEEIAMELQICRPLEGESLFDALRRLNRYGRMTAFPKSDLCHENLRKMIRVRPEVIHLSISCKDYRELASQALSLLSSTDNKLTRLPLHPDSTSTSGFKPSFSSSTCSHCNKKGHTERSCWKLHPNQKPTRGQLFQYLQQALIHGEQHMARPAGKRQPRNASGGRSTSPNVGGIPAGRQQRGGTPERRAERSQPKPAHILNQFPKYMSNPESENQIRDNLMPPTVPMTKCGQRDSLIQILWSNLLKTRIPVPASVLLAMTPNRAEQQNTIQNALSDALHQRLLTSREGTGGSSGSGGAQGSRHSGRPVIESTSSSEGTGGGNMGLGLPLGGGNIDVTTFTGSSPHLGEDPNVPPNRQHLQDDSTINQMIDSLFGGGGYDEIYHQIQQDDLEGWEHQQHLQQSNEQHHQLAANDDVYSWGFEHPHLTYATVEFEKGRKTRAMLDSGSTINTITRKVAERMGLTITPKQALFSTAAGSKEVIGEIMTTIKSDLYEGPIQLTVCETHPVGLIVGNRLLKFTSPVEFH